MPQVPHSYALLWSPIPIITWIWPFIGHFGEYSTVAKPCACKRCSKQRGRTPCLDMAKLLPLAGISSSTGRAIDFGGPYYVHEDEQGGMIFGYPTR